MLTFTVNVKNILLIAFHAPNSDAQKHENVSDVIQCKFGKA